jgi:hypothetical protein
MPGTYAEKAELATLNDFINLCKIALLTRAVELDTNNAALVAEMTGKASDPASTKFMLSASSLVSRIVNDADGYAKKMAWLVAAGNPTIGANAPAVPKEGDVQYAVNSFLPKLIG